MNSECRMRNDECGMMKSSKFRVEGGRLRVIEGSRREESGVEFFRGLMFGCLFSIPLWICVGLVIWKMFQVPGSKFQVGG